MTTNYVDNYVLLLHDPSCTFNFGNDPTVSAADKGLCCKPTNIGKNDIFLNLFVLAFFSLFADHSFDFVLLTYPNLFLRTGCGHSRRAHSLLLAFSGDVSTRNHRTTGNRMIRKARNKYVSCFSRIHNQAQFSYYINKIILFFVLQVSL